MSKSERPKSPVTVPAMNQIRSVKRHNIGSIRPPKIVDLGSENEAPKSHCIVCSGEIVESQENKESSTRFSITKTGYHCSRCGIAYVFLPKLQRK